MDENNLHDTLEMADTLLFMLCLDNEQKAADTFGYRCRQINKQFTLDEFKEHIYLVFYHSSNMERTCRQVFRIVNSLLTREEIKSCQLDRNYIFDTMFDAGIRKDFCEALEASKCGSDLAEPLHYTLSKDDIEMLRQIYNVPNREMKKKVAELLNAMNLNSVLCNFRSTLKLFDGRCA